MKPDGSESPTSYCEENLWLLLIIYRRSDREQSIQVFNQPGTGSNQDPDPPWDRIHQSEFLFLEMFSQDSFYVKTWSGIISLNSASDQFLALWFPSLSGAVNAVPSHRVDCSLFTAWLYFCTETPSFYLKSDEALKEEKHVFAVF